MNPTQEELYSGIEWLACWLIDNVEGEEITEEQLGPWAVKAWEDYMRQHSPESCEMDHRDLKRCKYCPDCGEKLTPSGQRNPPKARFNPPRNPSNPPHQETADGQVLA